MAQIRYELEESSLIYNEHLIDLKKESLSKRDYKKRVIGLALQKQLDDFTTALKRLNDSYKLACSKQNDTLFEYLRDSTIQRFEFMLEIAWKTIKRFLKEYEGVDCRSPKS